MTPLLISRSEVHVEGVSSYKAIYDCSRMVLIEEEAPELAAVWDNEDDAIFDSLYLPHQPRDGDLTH